MTFFPFNRLAFTASSPMTSAVVGISLTAVGTAIYLSPAGLKHATAQTDPARPTASAAPSTSPSAQAQATASAARTSDPAVPGAKHPKLTVKPIHLVTTRIRVVHAPAQTRIVVVKSQTTHTVTLSPTASSSSAHPTAPASIKHCDNFLWQQDAQAAYLANLSDPGALDGATGPHNGDGIACNNLPNDPDRAVSIPVDPYVAPEPTAASRTVLVQPAAKYFGIAQDGLPGDNAMYNRLATAAGKAPSSVGWFTGFDTEFGATQVKAAWAHGALPVITWMSVAADPTSGHTSGEYGLNHIIDGSLDPYLSRYAGDIVRNNLPVVIRFDHEMNGNWYPWSAGMYSNTPAKYVAAWQHIWNVFQSVGANTNVIWLWSPSRIDNLKPHAKTGGGVGQTNLAEDYPGDQYVDWVGASMYLRVTKTGPSYAATFGKTLTGLETLCSKPVFIPETAAIETDLTTGADVSSLKSQWIANAFAGFMADPRIVGFMWFNNASTATVNGVSVHNDWRIDSSPAALAAFRQGIAVAQFASGTLPDGYHP